MAIGLGVVLIVIGLIFALDVINADLSAIDGQTLGWILVIGGVLAVVLSLVINQQRTGSYVGGRRRVVVEERRVDDPPL
jgi:hypothetical protein